MKLNVTINGESCVLLLERRPANLTYALEGVGRQAGEASIAEVSAGIYSVLLGTQSFTVHLVSGVQELEVWIGKDRYRVAFSDIRDVAGSTAKQANKGPLEIRALMPGRIIRLLVARGDRVQLEQGVIVVEAMKMQNEMKSAREGIVSQIFVNEGAIVAAGEKLLVID